MKSPMPSTTHDMASLKDELGDLLFQVIFYAQMAKEAGDFDFQDVVAGISDKMVRRHPHVFADAVYDTPDEQLGAWEESKRRERAAEKGVTANCGPESTLDGVISALPALSRACKLQRTRRPSWFRLGFGRSCCR